MQALNKWLEDKLNYHFKDETLLKLSLTHRSACQKNNERLEFLGDAVLGSIIAEYIFNKKNESNEGDLTRYRAYLVKESTLCEIAREIELSNYLILGSGENKSGTRYRCSVLSDTLEALIGAIYLDSDFEVTKEVVVCLYQKYISDIPSMDELKDPKTKLQEIMQKEGVSLPEYTLIETHGEDHQQTFHVSCRLDKKNQITHGKGKSIRQAEQEAALMMLQQYEE